MKKTIFLKALLVLILLVAASCGGDDVPEESLAGEWIEVEPVEGRTILMFSSQNRVSRIDGEGNRENYVYRIEGDSIFLSLAEGQEGSSELYFNKADVGWFRIGNLYPSIPENEEIFMVFERN